jgi:hypothetical protein
VRLSQPSVVLGTFRAEGIICDVRQIMVDAPPEHVFALIGNLGGKNGWLFANFLWAIRGWIDQVIGGVGMKRGRSRASGIETGDVIDFWRAECADVPTAVLLRAEMKLHGEAWLHPNPIAAQFCGAAHGSSRTVWPERSIGVGCTQFTP